MHSSTSEAGAYENDSSSSLLEDLRRHFNSGNHFFPVWWQLNNFEPALACITEHAWLTKANEGPTAIPFDFLLPVALLVQALERRGAAELIQRLETVLSHPDAVRRSLAWPLIASCSPESVSASQQEIELLLNTLQDFSPEFKMLAMPSFIVWNQVNIAHQRTTPEGYPVPSDKLTSVLSRYAFLTSIQVLFAYLSSKGEGMIEEEKLPELTRKALWCLFWHAAACSQSDESIEMTLRAEAELFGIETGNIPTASFQQRLVEMSPWLFDVEVPPSALESPSMDVVKPILEWRWLSDFLAQVIAEDPEFAQTQAKAFYSALGEQLSAQASETTGDTAQELDRLEALFIKLNLAGKLPKNYVLADLGSGSGERLLRPCLRRLTEIGQKPGEVVAVDLLPFKPPADEAWTTQQLNLAKPFSEQPLVQAEKLLDRFDVITCSWSVLTDLTPPEQVQMIQTIASMLKLGGTAYIDIPRPGAYRPEVVAHTTENSTDHEGAFSKEFASSDGPISKTFYDTSWEKLMTMLTVAGLHPKRDILEMDYQTHTGRDRTTLVVEKVGEATAPLHLLLHQYLVGNSQQ